jgi:hypothetical protein
MEHEIDYKGHKYWVKVEVAVHAETQESGFVAYVSDQKPGGLLYGAAVKDPEGRVQFFTTKLSALTNANAVKQSELDRK